MYQRNMPLKGANKVLSLLINKLDVMEQVIEPAQLFF